MSPREEHKSTWQLLIGGVIAAVVIGVGLALLPKFPGTGVPSASPTATGLRSDPVGDEGTAVGSIARDFSAATTTVHRAGDIATPAKNDVVLNPKQRKTVDDFARKQAQDQTNDANLTTAIGAQVPANIQLHEMPISLANALPAYLADRYFLTTNQLVIVEDMTRRIVAIIQVRS
jgi:hypothetical protein